MHTQHNSDETIINDRILSLRLNFLYEKMIVSVVTTILAATLLVVGLYKTINMPHLIEWYIAIIVIGLVRLSIMKYYKYKNERPDLHLKLFIFGLGLAAITFGIPGSILMPKNAYLQQMFIIVCLTMFTAGSLQALQASLIASYCYPLLTMTPVMIWLFLQARSIYTFVGIAIFLFIIYTLIVAWRGYLTVVEMFTLRFQNAELIRTLSKANVSLLQMNESLVESQHRFQSAFDYAAIGMALVSLNGAWLKVNRSLCNLLGYSEEELLKIDFQTITYPGDLEADLNFIKQILAGEINNYQMEKRYFHKDKHVIWILLSVSLVKNQENKPLYFISQIQDISAKKHAEAELEHLAYHDLLTNIDNRALLEKNINQLIMYSKQKKLALALILIDLDNFKHINDELGHDVGDELLKEIARILTLSVRNTDKVARLGGDEFVIVISDLYEEKIAIEIANKILKAIMEPMNLKGHQVRITGSLGISCYPRDGTDMHALLKCADIALYQAKKNGGDNFQFYSKPL
ncbi:MAG: diguanylate cyclase [Gammaproteobacteria bacterium]|nr:diguanylate cyclase [Gammaproteobacteria bacterium]